MELEFKLGSAFFLDADGFEALFFFFHSNTEEMFSENIDNFIRQAANGSMERRLKRKLTKKEYAAMVDKVPLIRDIVKHIVVTFCYYK